VFRGLSLYRSRKIETVTKRNEDGERDPEHVKDSQGLSFSSWSAKKPCCPIRKNMSAYDIQLSLIPLGQTVKLGSPVVSTVPNRKSVKSSIARGSV
jgi:hypothetical protein